MICPFCQKEALFKRQNIQSSVTYYYCTDVNHELILWSPIEFSLSVSTEGLRIGSTLSFYYITNCQNNSSDLLDLLKNTITKIDPFEFEDSYKTLLRYKKIMAFS